MRAIVVNPGVETIQSHSCVVNPIVSSSCVTTQVANSSCVIASSVSSVCALVDAAGVSCIEETGNNWISWSEQDNLDWITIELDYKISQYPAEIRSSGRIEVLSRKSPTQITTGVSIGKSPRVGFPTTYVSVYNNSPNDNFVAFNSVVFPDNTPVLDLLGTGVIAYQTDNIAGPSEKVLVNVKQLRTQQIDKFKITFGGFHILNYNRLLEKPIKLRLLSGGQPIVVTEDTPEYPTPRRFWGFTNFPGYIRPTPKTLFTETVIKDALLPVTANSEANEITWLELLVSLEHKYLTYKIL